MKLKQGVIFLIIFYRLWILCSLWKLHGECINLSRNQEDLGWGSRHLCRCISKFLAVGRSIFPKKGVIFRSFRDISTKTTPKVTFYCILSTNFPKIAIKSIQKISAPSMPRKPPFFNFCPPPISLVWMPNLNRHMGV